MTGRNNWNSVCHNYLVECAALLIESPEERAKYLMPAIRNTVNDYIARNFRDDGYCPEGNGYWIYGFGNYAEMAEVIYQQTGGRINLLRGTEKIEAIIRFPLNFEMGGVWPAFSDAKMIVPGFSYVEWPLLALRGGVEEYRSWSFRPANGLLPALRRQHALDAGFTPNQAKPALPLYHYFREGGVVISRAAKEDASGFSLALKAGDNGDSHNHNDVGSFVIALRGVPVISDPGAPAGTNADLYSGRRYRNDFCNSFGHPVPVVGGVLQKEGAKFHGSILSTEFLPEGTDARLDLKPAYPDGAGLVKLERRFHHDRRARSITITDEAEFAEPRDFGAALITYGEVKELSPNIYRISWRGATARAAISGDGKLECKQETLNNRAIAQVKEPATRLGYNAAPARKHSLTVVITPEEE